MRMSRREALAASAGLALAASARASGAPDGAVDVVVIGAGVFGAWTAWHLKAQGLTVRLFDQYGAGNARASSGGESRVIRLSYGGDPIYSPMALDSLGQWAALSARLDQPILHRTGVLWFSPADDSYMANSLAWLRANGIAHETGDLAWLRRRFPQIAFREGESGFVESDTGALIAGRGVREVVADARLSVEPVAAGPPARNADGTYDLAGSKARSLVYACGPWLPRLFPEALEGRIVATRQEVYHFGPMPGDTRFAPPEMPVWAD